MEINTLDRFISWVSPSAGVKRISKRMALEAYEAAAKGRRTSHWKHSKSSADADLMPSLELLRNTSRNMIRNNPYAFQAIEGLVTNSIGTGIRLDITSEVNESALEKFKSYWERWAEKPECDFDGAMNFYGIQGLAARSMFESGECLIVKRKLPSSARGVLNIRLQVLEPDFIDSNRTYDNTGNGNYIRQGIEYNQAGQRVAYWLFKEHPGNQFGFYLSSYRVPAEDVIHLYRTLRPGQQRGVPTGVASFLRLNDFSDYEDAELMAAKVAACFVAFVSGSPDAVNVGGADAEDRREKVAPGIIEHLKQGETVTFGTPRATSGQGEYARKSLQGSAAGYGVTYEIMTGDLSNVNFSSMRIGAIEFHKRMGDLQLNTFIPKMCDRVLQWVYEAVQLQESIPVDQLKADWTAPRREMMDVDKETKAMGNQILFGLTSWSEAVRELGFNPDALLKAIAKDQANFKKYGVKLTSDASNTPPPAQNPADSQGKTGENDDKEDPTEDPPAGKKK
jgi:lambda family phage portal protein